MSIAHQLHLKEPQIHKMMEGKPVQISLEQMGAEKGKHVIYLAKPNAKKLMSSYKKGKGIRLTLTPEELDESIKSGAGILKSSVNSKMPKLVKGSQEAKDFMAKIRGKKGKGLGKDLGKILGTAGGTALGAMVGSPLIGATIGSHAGSALGGFAEKKLKGKGAKMSVPYKNALKMNFNGLELPMKIVSKKSAGKVDSRVKASGDLMTLSPYQKTSSPAMNPFVPKNYFQEGGTGSGYGEGHPQSNIYGQGLYGAESGAGMVGGAVKRRGRPRKIAIGL
jgi:hypothetical protein